MSRAVTVQQARAVLERIGCNVLEQRGFYSHFLRIRRGYRTLGTVDILKRRVGLRSILRVLEKDAKFVGPRTQLDRENELKTVV